VIFNIRHNMYRLITVLHYTKCWRMERDRWPRIIRSFLTTRNTTIRELGIESWDIDGYSSCKSVEMIERGAPHVSTMTRSLGHTKALSTSPHRPSTLRRRKHRAALLPYRRYETSIIHPRADHSERPPLLWTKMDFHSVTSFGRLEGAMVWCR